MDVDNVPESRESIYKRLPILFLANSIDEYGFLSFHVSCAALHLIFTYFLGPDGKCHLTIMLLACFQLLEGLADWIVCIVPAIQLGNSYHFCQVCQSSS